MPFPAVRARGVLLAAACLVAACSVTRQRVDLTVQGDVPAVDPQGKRLGPRARAGVGTTLARRITAAFRCADGGRSDRGPEACLEMAERPDREIVGGDLGIVANTLPGVQCAEVCSARVSIAPIASQLGQPPEPEEVARRIAPSGPTTYQVRTDVRHAYVDAVWARYRLYADYLSRQLSSADYVEIAPVSGGGEARRYRRSRIPDGLDDAMRDLADRYAALEWARFEREWGRAPVATRARPPRASPERRPALPAAPAEEAEERGHPGAAPPPTEQADGPAAAPASTPRAENASATPASTPRAENASATPASTPVATADDAPCRRSCSLRYRACLSRCRNQPITGGEYDACAYECSGASLACRGACGAPTAAP